MRAATWIMKRVRRPLFKLTANRSIGLWLEMFFWKRWLKSRGGHCPDLYLAELDPDQPLVSYLRKYVDPLPQTTVRILDVGAGPMTVLGKKHPTKTLEIVATDVLAPRYDEELARLGITPPVRTIYAAAEKLREVFAEESFDFVHANNCIDHASDPLRAVQEMIAVVRPGCWVFLRHRTDEAENEDYSGLHQWNFAEQEGRFIVWRPGTRIDIARELGDRVDVRCRTQDGHVFAEIHRKKTRPHR